MITGVDHVVIATQDLDAAIEDFTALGFAVVRGGRHAEGGTYNALIPLRTSYIELLSIFDPEELARAGSSQQQALSLALSRGKEGPLAFVLGTDDIEAVARAVRRAGMGAVEPYPMRRVRPDGSVVSWKLLVPEGSAIGMWYPYFIQWDEAPRLEALHPNGAVGLLGITVRTASTEPARALLAATGLEETRSNTARTFNAGPHLVTVAPSIGAEAETYLEVDLVVQGKDVHERTVRRDSWGRACLRLRSQVR